MRKILTQTSTTACGSPALRPYGDGSLDVSASSSSADPQTREPRSRPTLVPPSYSHRPTFGISLNELKAAIAPRAEHYSPSLDETDRSRRLLHICFCFLFVCRSHVPLLWYLLPVMESSRTCPWPRGSSRTISIVLGLGLGLVVMSLALASWIRSSNLPRTLTHRVQML